MGELLSLLALSRHQINYLGRRGFLRGFYLEWEKKNKRLSGKYLPTTSVYKSNLLFHFSKIDDTYHSLVVRREHNRSRVWTLFMFDD